MTGLLNRTRRFVDSDGRPVVPGSTPSATATRAPTRCTAGAARWPSCRRSGWRRPSPPTRTTRSPGRSATRRPAGDEIVPWYHQSVEMDVAGSDPGTDDRRAAAQPDGPRVRRRRDRPRDRPGPHPADEPPRDAAATGRRRGVHRAGRRDPRRPERLPRAATNADHRAPPCWPARPVPSGRPDQRGPPVRIRLDRADDLLHPVEAATNFNESRYYNFYDPGPGLGGWVRMGNRPNEGYAEMTVCLYLPDGPCRFHVQAAGDRRAHGPRRRRACASRSSSRSSSTASPTTAACSCSTSRARWSTRARRSPTTRWCRARSICTHRAVGRPWGGEPEREEGEGAVEVDPETSFARGHTEQHMAVTGTVTVGDDEFVLTDGLGLRDHSWGPRVLAEHLVVPVADGQPRPGPRLRRHGDAAGPRAACASHGFLYDRARYGDDRWVPVRDVELRSDYDDERLPPGGAGRADHRRPPRTRSTATCGRTSRCATAARRRTASS